MLGGLCCQELHAYFQPCTTPCTGMQVTYKGSRLSCQNIFGRMRPRAWNLSSWRVVILAQPVRGESLFGCPSVYNPLSPGMCDDTAIFWKGGHLIILDMRSPPPKIPQILCRALCATADGRLSTSRASPAPMTQQ